VKGTNGRAYNRTKHLPKRKRMMQAWADYLDSLRFNAWVGLLQFMLFSFEIP
jgi:hypothetical protein